MKHLNQQPLGYESKKSMTRLCLSTTCLRDTLPPPGFPRCSGAVYSWRLPLRCTLWFPGTVVLFSFLLSVKNANPPIHIRA
jgi:hypothetical protein